MHSHLRSTRLASRWLAHGATLAPDMPRQSHPAVDVREACIHEALAIIVARGIGARGIGALSLREVARRLGISHQAPCKRYPSRDHLLAEVMRRAFADLHAMGQAYLDYALRHPLQYRLIFGTPCPMPRRPPR
jgi:AcrR family transcriptional regulator